MNYDSSDSVTPINMTNISMMNNTIESDSIDDIKYQQATPPSYAYYDIDDNVDIAMFLSHRIHKLRSKLDVIIKSELLHPQYNVAISNDDDDVVDGDDGGGDNVDGKSKAYIEV